jgi:hypothetical protein
MKLQELKVDSIEIHWLSFKDLFKWSDVFNFSISDLDLSFNLYLIYDEDWFPKILEKSRRSESS